jgi:hypothetical protein
MKRYYQKYQLIIFFVLLLCPNARAQLNRPLKVLVTEEIWFFDTVSTMKPDRDYQAYRILARSYNDKSGLIMVLRNQISLGRNVYDTLNIIQLNPEHNWVYADSIELIKYVDINMDGYDDIFILRSVEEVTWKQYYDIWLFNHRTGKFYFNQIFSDKIEPDYDMDEENKTITTIWVAFPNTNHFGSNTYKVEGDTLILIRSEEE